MIAKRNRAGVEIVSGKGTIGSLSELVAKEDEDRRLEMATVARRLLEKAVAAAEVKKAEEINYSAPPWTRRLPKGDDARLEPEPRGKTTIVPDSPKGGDGPKIDVVRPPWARTMRETDQSVAERRAILREPRAIADTTDANYKSQAQLNAEAIEIENYDAKWQESVRLNSGDTRQAEKDLALRGVKKPRGA